MPRKRKGKIGRPKKRAVLRKNAKNPDQNINPEQASVGQNSSEKRLGELYFNNQIRGSLRGVQTLYESAIRDGLQVSLAQVRRFLKGQPTYNLWKPARKNYPRNPYDISEIGHLQFDLADFQQTPEYDKSTGKKMIFLLCAIDSFSRYAWAIPLHDRTSAEVIRGLKEIFDSGYSCHVSFADPAGKLARLKTTIM